MGLEKTVQKLQNKLKETESELEVTSTQLKEAREQHEDLEFQLLELQEAHDKVRTKSNLVVFSGVSHEYITFWSAKRTFLFRIKRMAFLHTPLPSPTIKTDKFDTKFSRIRTEAFHNKRSFLQKINKNYTVMVLCAFDNTCPGVLCMSERRTGTVYKKSQKRKKIFYSNSSS